MWNDRRWLLSGIVVSVLLNIFLVGAVAGRILADNNHHIARLGRALVPAAQVRELPSDEVRRFREAARQHRPAIRAARQTLRMTRRDAENAIGAPTLDKTKVEAELARVRTASAQVQEAVHASLLDALATLSPASRSALSAHSRFGAASEPAEVH